MIPYVLFKHDDDLPDVKMTEAESPFFSVLPTVVEV